MESKYYIDIGELVNFSPLLVCMLCGEEYGFYLTRPEVFR